MLRLQLDRCHSAATRRSISLTWSDRSARLPASPWENLANRREPEPLRAGCAVVVPVQPRVVHEDLEAAADKQDDEEEVDVVGDTQPGWKTRGLRRRLGDESGQHRR